MARKEEKEQSVPALVDYNGEANLEHGDVTADRFTSNNLEAHFRRLTLSKHRSGGVLFSIKDKTLLKRLLEEFGPTDSVAMVTKWVSSKPLKEAVNVGYFYHSRYDLFDDIKPKDYSDWLE